jgi:hypothetical protein
LVIACDDGRQQTSVLLSPEFWPKIGGMVTVWALHLPEAMAWQVQRFGGMVVCHTSQKVTVPAFPVTTSKGMRAVHALQNWIAEMMVPPKWRRFKEQLRCLSLQWKNTEKHGLARLRHRVAHLSSETSNFKAMRAVHALQSWIAEMMVPPRWR